jgi:predicted porin
VARVSVPRITPVRCYAAAVLVLTSLGIGVAPRRAAAQAGFYVTPSFSVAEIYDDNIFATHSGRESDFITRFTPGLRAGYESAPLTLLGHYAFDAELFAEHSELNSGLAGQDAGVDFKYLPDPTLTLSVIGRFLESHTPGVLSATTGITNGRVKGRRYSVEPSVAYRFDPVTTATVDYSFAREEASGIRTDIHTVGTNLERRLGAQDAVSVGYAFRDFVFPEEDDVTAHVALLGWTHDLSPQTKFTLKAGPRFSEGSVDPEALASITHRLEHGEVSLGYTRTQTTVVGRGGVGETDAVIALLSYDFLPTLRLRGGPSFYRTTFADSDAKVYRIDVEVIYQLTRWLALELSYAYSLQQGVLGVGPGTAGSADDEISRNVVMLRLTASYPYRVQ